METLEACGRFLLAKQAKGLSPRTLETYRYRLFIFARFAPELPMSAEELEEFLSLTGPTQHTRETYFRLLRNLYRWLVRRGALRHNPLAEVEPPVLPKKIARSLSKEELASLLQHPSHSRVVRAFLFLLADTGLRLSEALSVRTTDQVYRNTVFVTGKVGERQVPISPLVKGMVVDVLPWPWGSGQPAGLAVRRAFARAGIKGKRASAHTLRHTFVRLWEGDETLLVGILGWTSTRMLKVYRPYDVKRAVEQHARYSPIEREMWDTPAIPFG